MISDISNTLVCRYCQALAAWLGLLNFNKNIFYYYADRIANNRFGNSWICHLEQLAISR